MTVNIPRFVVMQQIVQRQHDYQDEVAEYNSGILNNVAKRIYAYGIRTLLSATALVALFTTILTLLKGS